MDVLTRNERRPEPYERVNVVAEQHMLRRFPGVPGTPGAEPRTPVRRYEAAKNSTPPGLREPQTPRLTQRFGPWMGRLELSELTS